jgi:hypothetical protein
MMRDELHPDWADPVCSETECELEFVCPNHDCRRYTKAVYVRCRTELGHTSPVDDRDLDCPCGERLVQVDLLGCESVSPQEIKRLQAVGA